MQKEENILHIKLSLHGNEHICMLHQKNGENQKLMFNVHNIENLDSYTKLLEVIKKYDTVTFNNTPYTTNNIQNTKNLQNIIEDWYANEVALFPKGFSNLYNFTEEDLQNQTKEDLNKHHNNVETAKIHPKHINVKKEKIAEEEYGTKVNPFNIKEYKDKQQPLLQEEKPKTEENLMLKAGRFAGDGNGSIGRI